MGIQIQERDLQFLMGLFESRIMKLSQAKELYYPTSPERGRIRIAQLKSEGLVREKARAGVSPSILFLGSKGFKMLRDGGHLAMFPPITLKGFQKRVEVSPATIEHELEVVDVKLALAMACRERKCLELLEVYTWPRLFEFTAQRPIESDGAMRVREAVVRPDAFVRIRKNGGESVEDFLFFIEVDRGTERQAVLINKAVSYLNYYRAGGMAERYGFSADEYRRFPFRVLFVFPSDERRNNAAEALLRDTRSIRRITWLGTRVDLLGNPLGRIWATPLAYETALQGTQFGVGESSRPTIYRRNPHREQVVKENLKLQALF